MTYYGWCKRKEQLFIFILLPILISSTQFNILHVIMCKMLGLVNPIICSKLSFINKNQTMYVISKPTAYSCGKMYILQYLKGLFVSIFRMLTLWGSLQTYGLFYITLQLLLHSIVVETGYLSLTIYICYIIFL